MPVRKWLIPCMLQTRFFERDAKLVQNAFLCEKSVQKHSWRFFAFSDLWQNGSRNEGVFQKHAERKMKKLAQKGTKRTKLQGECVKASLTQFVAAETRRRSRLRRSIEWTSNQPAWSNGIRRLTSAATGRPTASLLCAENVPGFANGICNSLISMKVSDISRLVGGHERLLPRFSAMRLLRFFAANLLASHTLCAKDISV